MNERLEELSKKRYLNTEESEEYVSFLTRDDLMRFIRYQNEAMGKGHHRAMEDIARFQGFGGIGSYSWESYFAKEHKRVKGLNLL